MSTDRSARGDTADTLETICLCRWIRLVRKLKYERLWKDSFFRAGCTPKTSDSNVVSFEDICGCATNLRRGREGFVSVQWSYFNRFVT